MGRPKKEAQGDAPPTTGLIPWKEQMKKDAKIASAMEAHTGGGKFFSMKAGVLSFDGNPIKGNKMPVIISAHILENVFYAGKFADSDPQPPACWAFGNDEPTMEPHKVCVDAGTAKGSEQGTCKGCPMNEWASAETGKGKACRNTRRLCLLPAGKLDAQGRFVAETDAALFKTLDFAYMRLPVTSVKAFSAYVKQIEATTGMPPHGVVTLISVVPDQKTQFKVQFECLEEVSDAVGPISAQRHEEAVKTIDFPYPTQNEDAAKPKAGKAGKKKF